METSKLSQLEEEVKTMTDIMMISQYFEILLEVI